MLQLYVFEKLSRNQSWVNLLFSVLRDSILDAILDSLFSILDFRFAQESSVANQVENRDSHRTVNLLLNGTIIDLISKKTNCTCSNIILAGVPLPPSSCTLTLLSRPQFPFPSLFKSLPPRLPTCQHALQMSLSYYVTERFSTSCITQQKNV